MAVTNTQSDVYALQSVTSTGARAERDLLGSELLYCEPTVTQGAAAGDANSTLELVKVPSGTRLILALSKLRWTAFGAARVLSLGYRAYQKADGTTQAQSLTALGTGLDVSAASTAGAFLNTLTSPIQSYFFEGEAVIVLQCTGGTIPAGAVVQAFLVCARR